MKFFLIASILFFLSPRTFASSDLSKALFNAIEYNNLEKVRELLEKLDESERKVVLHSLAVDRIFVEKVSNPFPIFITPLHFACGKGLVDIARLLLNYGADINFHVGGLPATPLLYAVHYGQTESVNFLLLEGANVNLAPLRVTPLMHACSLSNIKIVELLLEHKGTKIHASFSNGSGAPRTALMVALHRGILEIVNLLIEAGAIMPEEMIARYTYLEKQRAWEERERAERQREREQAEREREQAERQREIDLNEVMLLQRQDWLAYERLSDAINCAILVVLSFGFYGY